MTSDELHKAAVIAKAEMVIEMLWTHLYDTEMAYHQDGGAQGYMGGMIRQVLDQMDGLLDEMVDKTEKADIYEDTTFADAISALNRMVESSKK